MTEEQLDKLIGEKFGFLRRTSLKVIALESAKQAGISSLWWRVQEQQYANSVDEYGDPVPGTGTMEIIAEWFTVVKRTPKGVWLSAYGMTEKRFVLNGARKKFACPTLINAFGSFIERKKRQHGIYTARAKAASRAKLMGEELANSLSEMLDKDGESDGTRSPEYTAS